MKKAKKFRMTYDKEGDILYISRGGLTKEDTSEELEEDIVVWKNKKTNDIRGFTILNFSKRAPKDNFYTVNLPVDFEMRPSI